MNNLTEKDLQIGEIYYHFNSGYEFIYIHDGKHDRRPVSGPYYINGLNGNLSSGYRNPLEKNDILRLATFEERKKLIEKIISKDPNFTFIIPSNSNYEIY